MEQQFILSYHGRLTLPEQATMTGEERSWWIERVQAEVEKQNKSGDRRAQ